MSSKRMAIATLFATIFLLLSGASVLAQCPEGTIIKRTGLLDINGQQVMSCIPAGTGGVEAEFRAKGVGVTKRNTDIFVLPEDVPAMRGPYQIGEEWPNKVATIPAGSSVTLGQELDEWGNNPVQVRDGNVQGFARRRDIETDAELIAPETWAGRLLSPGEGACGVGFELVVGLGCVHSATYYNVAPKAYDAGRNGAGVIKPIDFGQPRSGDGLTYDTVNRQLPPNTVWSQACDCWTVVKQ